MRIAFIGAGIMGEPMCRHLLNAGYDVHTGPRSAERVARLETIGAVRHERPVDGVADAEVVMTCLGDEHDVKQVTGELLPHLQDGQLLIDLTTSSAEVARELTTAAGRRGVQVVDAPVSGGQGGAEAGTLTVMVGGSEDAVARATPLLEIFGGRVTHVGPAGAGQVCKAANQMIVAATISAVAEALLLSERAGVDPAKVHAALRGGFADSTVLGVHGQRILDQDHEPGFRAELHEKDLRLALDLARNTGTPLPTTSVAAQLLAGLRGAGEQDLDHSALDRTLRRLAGAELREREA